MEEEVSVDMDGQWHSATAPNWLTTLGVSTCIAVAIADNENQMAWLIHSPTFGHETKPLELMFAEAASKRPSGAGLNIWVFGGVAADADCEDEAILAQEAVESLVSRSLPEADVCYRWRESGNVQVIFRNKVWRCTFDEML